MKKTLLIALLLIPFLGISQTTKPIDGFLGIKFGSSKATVITALKTKGAILDKEDSKADELIFTNVKLGQRGAEALYVFFVSDKVYAAAFDFKPDDRPTTVGYYSRLVDDINGVYGSGKPYKHFKTPYEEGDGAEIVALQSGYAQMFTDWESGKNSIQVSIKHDNDDDLYILLRYEDGVLSEAANAKEKAKDKADY